jgi:hypothetical protein
MRTFFSRSLISHPARILVLVVLIFPFLSFSPALSYMTNANQAISVLSDGDRIIDNDTWIDANNLEMVVTNHGSFGWDLESGDPGLIYPAGSSTAVLFAGGIWIFGMTDEGLRGAIGEYSQEYAAGVIYPDGSWSPESSPQYRVYKLTETSGPGDQDYDEWPVGDGAPLGPDGEPLRAGDHTLWCVYHDADPSKHTNSAGNTDPIGVEVHHLTYAYDLPDPLDRVILIDFKLTHKGPLPLTETFVGFWLDTDIGDAPDDVAGSDSVLQAAFGYNGDGFDDDYGPDPPALGVTFLGENRSAYAAMQYINGTDPDVALMTYNYLRGLQPNGDPMIDPITGEPTRFWYGGDPVTGEGWIDTSPADKRVLLSVGPFDFVPGQVEEFRIALVVGQGPDRIASVDEMKAGIRVVRRLHEKGAFPDRRKWALAGLYPSPFCAGEDPQAWTFLVAPRDGTVSVRVVDEGYAHVRVLLDAVGVQEGIRRVLWDGADDLGNPVPPGAYRLLLRVKDPVSPWQGLVWDTEEIQVTCPSAPREPWSGIAERMVHEGHAAVSNAPDGSPTCLFLAGSGTIPLEGVGEASGARLEIFDILGRRVWDGSLSGGEESVFWDGRNSAGRKVPAGLYFYSVRPGWDTKGRILLVR